MTTRLQNLAAAHNALWSDDFLYRLSWFIWPLSVISLVAGWLIFHGAPEGTGGQAPWVSPAEQAPSSDEMDKRRKAADQGDADAQNNIGWRYYQGNGVAQDYAQAMSWWRKAADQGDADAQNNIGWLYDHSEGVAQDYAQAMSWYRKAADQGHAEAQYNIGVLFEEGNGVSRKMSPQRKSGIARPPIKATKTRRPP
jgi:Sel1 repeat